MFWLGLAMLVVYIPGWTGATIPTSWALLSLVLPLALWRPVEVTGFHWAILSWAALAWVYVPFSLSVPDAVWGAWQVSLFAMAFWVGSSLDSPSALWRGVGWGLNLTFPVALAQAFGYHPTLEFLHVYPSAVYYNSMLYGEICAIAILGLILYRHWTLIPLPLAGLVLSHSHGGWLALIAGIIAWRHRSIGLLALMALAAAVAFTYHLRSDDAERLQVWYAAVTNLSPLGHGPGSFLSLWWQHADTAIYPEYAHNDYLQLAFEYGALSVVPLLAIGAPGLAIRTRDWPIYAAFLLMATFSFPLYSYILAPLGAISAGCVARSWDLHRRYCSASRLDQLQRSYLAQRQARRHWGVGLPMVSRS